MNPFEPLKEAKSNTKIKQLKQTIILNKSHKSKKRPTIPTKSTFSKVSFNISTFSYLNVKKKSKVNFGQGKINLNTSKDENNCINLTFYDTSLRLRFQAFINKKKSSINIDINNENCLKINQIIGLAYYFDENGERKYDTILTNIFIYFMDKKDINNFFNSICQI